MNSKDLRNLQEAYTNVYIDPIEEEVYFWAEELIQEGYNLSEYSIEELLEAFLNEKENSPYEKASDAALDSRYGYGRATGDKRSFGRAANRSSAAAALRALRRGQRSGSGTSTEAGSDAVHQGWARTAKTSTDQTPEKKARRAGLANTPYSNLPNDEKEKDRVSFNAVKAVYNRNKPGKVSEEIDLYDLILSHLLDEGYTDSLEGAKNIIENMSEGWIENIIEASPTNPSLYKGKHGQTEKEYMDNRSTVGKLISGDSYETGRQSQIDRFSIGGGSRPNRPGERPKQQAKLGAGEKSMLRSRLRPTVGVRTSRVTGKINKFRM